MVFVFVSADVIIGWLMHQVVEAATLPNKELTLPSA